MLAIVLAMLYSVSHPDKRMVCEFERTNATDRSHDPSSSIIVEHHDVEIRVVVVWSKVEIQVCLPQLVQLL